jgi:Pyruvate/2-oxoacid:ferredoxin oxidoreductase delta subunit
MMAVGIPEYRLPREVIAREYRHIQDLGVEVRLNTAIGPGGDQALDDLFTAGYGAVCLAIGAHRSHELRIPGEELPGVVQGIELLQTISFSQQLDAPQYKARLERLLHRGAGTRVAILGGGNTAMDVSRSLRRFGIENVRILYRRTRTEMPAYTEEIEATLEEGVRIEYLVTPSYIHRDSHRYPVLCCLRNVLAKPDRDGRRRPETIPGSEFNLPVSFIIDAVGDYPDPDSLTADAEEARLLQAQNVWGQTGLEKVWIGGDFGGGNRTVAYAIGSGKRAAASIHHHLIGAPGDPAGLLPGIGSPISTAGLFPGAQPSYIGEQSVAIDDLNLAYFRRTKRTRQPEQGTAIRIQSFIEVEGNVSDAGLRWEAGRCFHCGACDDCGNCHVFCPDGAVVRKLGDGRLEFDLDHCKGCGICKEECPRAAIEMAR